MVDFLWQVMVPIALYLLVIIVVVGALMFIIDWLGEYSSRMFWNKEKELIDDREEERADARL